MARSPLRHISPLLLLLVAVPAALGEAVTATPLSKVLELLENLAAKGVKEKEEEANKFTVFSKWCKDQTAAKTVEIADDKTKVGEAKALIEKSEASIASFTGRIADLNKDIAKLEAEKTSVTDVRKKEAIDYAASLKDFEESLTAITQAITTIKAKANAKPALLEVRSLHLKDKRLKDALDAFMEEGAAPAPATGAYESQSGGIVELLERLKGEFSEQNSKLQAEETKAKAGFEKIVGQLTSNIEFARKEVGEKTTALADSRSTLAQAKGSLADNTKELKEDQKYLDDTTKMCTTKMSDFESRQQLRGQELEALAKASEILKTKVASKSAALLQLRQQVSAATAMAWLRSTSNEGQIKDKLANFLQDRASRLNSRLLSMLAQRVAQDPFGKVKKMIQDLVTKMTEEGALDVEQKAWCDSELKVNQLTRDTKTQEVTALKAKVDGISAQIVQLTQDIKDLGAKVQELDAARAKATAERQAAKKANEETIKTAKECEAGVQEASVVLRDFYASAATAKAFLEVDADPAKDAPATFTEPYTGLAPKGGSVLDFLEVIASDYARLNTETSAQEASEAKQYQKFMDDSEQDKALKLAEQKHKDEKKVEQAASLQSTKEEVKGTQEQLDKALTYFEKLKQSCMAGGSTYEERAKQRKDEIKSLQEALDLLTAAGAAK